MEINEKKHKILIICGATASGKTSLSVECAKLLNTEIISADSMSIYKGLNIGSAKPTEEEKQNIKHNMIDIAETDSNFSVSDFKEKATSIIDKLLSEDKIPIISGGTGFYINSILYDFSYGNASRNDDIRQKYEAILLDKGKEYLFSLLKKVDEKSSMILHENDTKRVIRALEIFETSGKPKSEYNDNLTSKYDYLAVSIDYPREVLYERINKRVDNMLENGLILEVQELLKSGVTIKNQCMQGIGYKEVLEYLEKKVTYEKMVENIKQNSRHYAKRQITYFKTLKGLIYLQPASSETLARRVIELL